MRWLNASPVFSNRHLESFHRLTRDVSVIERRAVFTLVAVAVAAANLFVPASADAEHA